MRFVNSWPVGLEEVARDGPARVGIIGQI